MKALSVFSGGLDSMLAAQLLRAQDIDVQALFFETPFFTSSKPKKSAARIDLPIKVVDLTFSHMEIVKHPKHGYGGNMNPCIDCHTLMLREAGGMLESEGASFLITGEVLGQRPMSQNKQALAVVARESGYPDLILRPLSAKLLPPTLPEEEGWVDREALMGFSGRSRKPQMELAKAFGIKEYPSPAGGCLLTDRIFSNRLKDLFKSDPNPDVREIQCLKVGRHFRLAPDTKCIVGRNKGENQALQGLMGRNDILLSMASVPGPTALLIGRSDPLLVDLCAALTASYSDARPRDRVEMKEQKEGAEEIRTVVVENKAAFRGFMI